MKMFPNSFAIFLLKYPSNPGHILCDDKDPDKGRLDYEYVPFTSFKMFEIHYI